MPAYQIDSSDIDIVIDSNGRIRGIDLFNKTVYTIDVRKSLNSWRAVLYYGISENHIKGTDYNTYPN